MRRLYCICLCVLSGVVGMYSGVCAAEGVSEQKTQKARVFKEEGKASFYAMKFQSKKTASGELFDQNKKTAAHKKLAFGTQVKVTNVKNNKSVVVRVNDRGPFTKGRIIDLSRSAFGEIGDFDSGVINVKIEVVK